MKNHIITLCACCMFLTAKAQQPNIIFFLVDDLNDYVGHLGGHPQVSTPHIDALAEMGVTFVNAYASEPGCAPSRTSMLSGKSPQYTRVFSNDDYQNPFRDNFSEATENATVFTLPEILKDSGNYFTYALGKVFHSPTENDHDKVAPTCSKSLSWNRMHSIQESAEFTDEIAPYMFSPELDFGMIPNDMESEMCDQRLADSAVAFIHGFADHTVNTCERPFFLALGIRKPHSDRLIPEHYFLPYYAPDLLIDSLPIIYNHPADATPYNGLVMPPQPDPMFSDYYALPEDGAGRALADQTDIYEALNSYVDDLPYLPVIDPALTDVERTAILEETMRANYVSSYIAAVQYMDSIVGKVMAALQEHPDLAANTVVIFTSDHGYALGEKRHWTKWALWETDIRVPLIIAHPEYAQNAVCKRVTSLLDIFPTVCSIAGVSYPTFPDGSAYLDGHDLMPYLSDPGKNPAGAALTFNKNDIGAGSCYQHYSVRTERFHYIRYRLNGDDPEGDACDTATAYFEYELYDIGAERQTDPYEWNNVADDPEYAPVMPYLESFLPDGALFNQEPLTLNIYTNTTDCLLAEDAIVDMRGLLLHPDGTLIEEPELSNYTCKWTNNLTDDSFTGMAYSFALTGIDHMAYAAANDLIFYATVTENATGDIAAFRTRVFQLHPESLPEIDYSIATSGLEMDIQDVMVNGSAQSVSWNFGDGISVTQTDPGPHTYAAEGSYTVTTTMQYGNKCTITQSAVVHVDSTEFRIQQPQAEMQVFPNPASDHIIIKVPDHAQNCQAELNDMQGNRLHTWPIPDADGYTYIALSNIPAGTYLLRVTGDQYQEAQLLVVQHH